MIVEIGPIGLVFALGYWAYYQFVTSFIKRHYTVNGMVSPRSHQLKQTFDRISRYRALVPMSNEASNEERRSWLRVMQRKCIDCDELLRPHEPSETKWSWFLWTPPGLQQVLQDTNKSLLEIEHELDVFSQGLAQDLLKKM